MFLSEYCPNTIRSKLNYGVHMYFPLSENVTAVDTKGPIIRFIEQLKLFIGVGGCDV